MLLNYMLHYSRIDNMFYGHTSLDIAFWFFQAAIYNRVVRWTRLKGTQSISSGRAWMYNLTVLKIYPLYKRYTITMINLIFTFFFFFFFLFKSFNLQNVKHLMWMKFTSFNVAKSLEGPKLVLTRTVVLYLSS